MKAILMLEDGTVFLGNTSIRAERVGEIFFNTAVVGYQELLTNPVYANKILVYTYPLVGNYGMASKFNETERVWLNGFVIKQKSSIYSNWQAKESLDDFIKRHKLLTIWDVDTRSLTVHLRQKGQMLAIISTECFKKEELVKKIKIAASCKKESLLPKISTNKIKVIGKKNNKKIAVLDLGLTKNIINQLEALDFSIFILPFNTEAKKILNLNPKGLIISSGPEDDVGIESVISNIKELIGKIPILGISLGCQILARSLGAKLVKLKIGHNGLNYPIKGKFSYKGEITVQNHFYTIDIKSLRKVKAIDVVAYNLNDGTVEEIESKKFKFFGILYYPVSGGFRDINPIFLKFCKILNA
ncbi:MAG: glutamine-hydrolyzing carbamoyl-phosphate synthase small subunit [Candidatus Omnitrophica bacterium]|nr:glutamine-hydrolyzing carbamoyl-phosphate synthase small subunit [Candidatus Omnitrophota bacterium]